jgi:hypothetical protein
MLGNMRTSWLLAALVACGSPPTPTTVSNVAPPPPPPTNRPGVEGTVVDFESKEKLSGVAIVVNDQKDAVAITDENGAYKIYIPRPGRYRVTLYYLEITVERDVDVNGPTKVDQELDQTWGQRGAPTRRCSGPRATDCRPARTP